MKHMRRLVCVLLVAAACNPVTVVPIDDEDAGDAAPETSTPAFDAGADAPADAADEG